MACSPGNDGGGDVDSGALFARLALETRVRLDHEPDALGLQARGHFFPLRHRQHDAHMPHWDAFAVHRIEGCRGRFLRRKVRHDLVSVKIEVDPLGAGAALRASQRLAVKLAGKSQVVHRKGHVEWGQEGGVGLGGLHEPNPTRGPITGRDASLPVQADPGLLMRAPRPRP